MKGNILLIAMVALCHSGICARGLSYVAEQLGNIRDYSAAANISVQLPQGSDVNYDLQIYATSVTGDSLCAANYLIEWVMPGNESSRGFTAYFDGHLYRYGDGRLTEYHFEWDSVPFLSGNGRAAVQNNAQFIAYTPAKIAETLNEIATDDCWSYSFAADTLFNGKPADALCAEYSTGGYVGRRLTIIFDTETSLPRYYESENNPASISEQIITVSYGDAGTVGFPVSSEADLIGRYPEVFGNFRESNFRVESLRGQPLVTFSLPASTGERYSHAKGDGFGTPLLIVFFDPSVATSVKTIGEVRRGIRQLPGSAGIIFVSVSTDIDGAEEAVSDLSPGESLLVSGRTLARDCGVTSYPTFLFVGRDGKVRDIAIGFNNSLSETVMEKMALTN